MCNNRMDGNGMFTVGFFMLFITRCLTENSQYDLELIYNEDKDITQQEILIAEVNLKPVNLHNVLDATERILIFFTRRSDKMNLDGMFAVRVLQGELGEILKKYKDNEYQLLSHDEEAVIKIYNILALAEQLTSPTGMKTIKALNEGYYHSFEFVLQTPWVSYQMQPRLVTKVDVSVLPALSNIDTHAQVPEIEETDSDRCMMSLFGKEKFAKCSVEVCWDFMTRMSTDFYYTTHQLLWLQLGIKFGCQAKLEEHARKSVHGSLENIIHKLCTNVVFSMEAMVDHLTNSDWDIFLEQGFVCGSMGYVEAVQRDFIELAVAWQDPVLGCYRDLDQPILERKVAAGYFDQHKIKWRQRNLLNDVNMGDHCSSHMTGVAVGFLVASIRSFIDPKFIELLQSINAAPNITSNTYPIKSLLILLILVLLCPVALRYRLRFFSKFAGLKSRLL